MSDDLEALKRAQVHEARNKALVKMLSNLIERNGGPLERDATINLAPSTVASWLVDFGPYAGPDPALTAALAEVKRLREATEELVKEANRIGPQLPYNAPTASLAAAIDKARAALTQQPQAGGGE